jgi:hypothetical protein
MLKKILKEATRIEEWQQEIYTALHNINAEWITSGRLSLSRLPDGEADKVLVAQGIGKDPVWADPNFNLIRIGGVDITGRDWSSDFAKLQNLDTALSTRASESTLSGIKSQTDKLTFDTSNRLAIQNPPNLDVALSTRASESTLSSFVGTPDSSPPSKGVVLLGYDGTYLRRVLVDSSGKLLTI